MMLYPMIWRTELSVSFDGLFILQHWQEFALAVWVTLKIGLVAIAGATLVGLLNAIVLRYANKPVRLLIHGYTEVARNTPLLIQLFVIYFGLPEFGIRLSGEVSAWIAMIFLGGAYLTEIFRSGLQAVAESQLESARALGLSRWQQLRYVLIPQAWSISLPALFASYIFLLKETTVVSAVAVPEILYATTNYIALYYKTYEMLALMTLLYVAIFVPLSLALHRLEKRVQHAQFGY